MFETACGPNTTYLFFEQADNGRYSYRSEAVALCRICPSSADLCPDYSMSFSVRDNKGIWAGMGEPDRKRLRKLRARHAGAFTKVITDPIREVVKGVEQETMCRVQALFHTK